MTPAERALLARELPDYRIISALYVGPAPKPKPTHHWRHTFAIALFTVGLWIAFSGAGCTPRMFQP